MYEDFFVAVTLVNLQANVEFLIVLQQSGVLYQQRIVRLNRMQHKSVASVEVMLGRFSGTIFRYNVKNTWHANDLIFFNCTVH